MTKPRRQQAMNWTTELRQTLEILEREHKAHIDIRLDYHRSDHRAYVPYLTLTAEWLQSRCDMPSTVALREPRDPRRWPVLESQICSLAYRVIEKLIASEGDTGRIKPLFPDWQPKV